MQLFSVPLKVKLVKITERPPLAIVLTSDNLPESWNIDQKSIPIVIQRFPHTPSNVLYNGKRPSLRDFAADMTMEGGEFEVCITGELCMCGPGYELYPGQPEKDRPQDTIFFIKVISF